MERLLPGLATLSSSSQPSIPFPKSNQPHQGSDWCSHSFKSDQPVTGHSCWSHDQPGVGGGGRLGPWPTRKRGLYRASRTLGKTHCLPRQSGHRYSHHLPRHRPRSSAIGLSAPRRCGLPGAWLPEREGRARQRGTMYCAW